ncbi:MAG: hypothetical protein H6872_09690 [Methylobacteriaceae bacterium]|nr:hypothetical protein [Rhodoblastus sp.]MCC0005392.1 hypothetical protein [Methylobacteriaceae bacterium]
MRADDHDFADCFDCPLLAGLTDAQKRERIRTDPLIAKCMANRKAVLRKQKRGARGKELCLIAG